MAASKKWWWLVGVAVPIAVAVIAIVPDLLQKRASGEADTFRVIGTQFNGEVTFNSVSIVLEQARRAGQELPDSVVETLRQAVHLAQARQFDAAIPLLESVADAAPVPALLNNVGAAYLATGDRERAEEYFEQALARSPEERSAQFNLSQLTRSRTELSSGKLRSPSPATSTSTLMRSSSQIPGVSAELIEFSRFERTITVKVRFINSGEENQEFDFRYQHFGDSYLLDEATNNRFTWTARSNADVTVPAGGNVEFWTKYTLPEGEKPQYLTLVFGHGILFEHIEVP